MINLSSAISILKRSKQVKNSIKDSTLWKKISVHTFSAPFFSVIYLSGHLALYQVYLYQSPWCIIYVLSLSEFILCHPHCPNSIQYHVRMRFWIQERPLRSLVFFLTFTCFIPYLFYFSKFFFLSSACLLTILYFISTYITCIWLWVVLENRQRSHPHFLNPLPNPVFYIMFQK